MRKIVDEDITANLMVMFDGFLFISDYYSGEVGRGNSRLAL